MAKLYLFGKVLDPELKQTTKGQLYLRFCVYANHESMQFDVYEKQTRTVNGQQEVSDNPLFGILADIPDGTPVMLAVRAVYSDRSKAVRYYLDDVYLVDETARQAINGVLSRKPVGDVKA